MKIIVIGNGFDLNLGLKTSYKDFIESDYFNTLIKENNSLATYLIAKNNLNNWVDIEKEIAQYSIYIQNTYSNVKNDFEKLKTSLANYLKEAQEGEINQDSQAFKMIQEEIQSADKIAKLLDATDIDIKHSYVHGSIENMDIIFGVEDDARIYPNHIFFKKSYNKNFAESDISNYLNNENDLIIFGHSLGVTDSSYFLDYIIALLDIHTNPELKFYHYGESGYDELMIMLDFYTHNRLTRLKHNNRFLPIDSFKK
jgi:hypothetical protein